MAAVQVDAHRDLSLLHHTLAVFFAVARQAAALLNHMHVIEEEIDQALIEIVDAGVTHRGQDAAQVGVAGEERRLHQRRVRNGIGRQLALGFRAATLHLHGDELGGALAVAHDGLGELLRNRHHGLGQRQALRRTQRGDRRVPGLLRGHQHEAVVGGGVAIDGDAVEAGIGRLLGKRLQRVGIDHGVGGHEAQHRGHVRANHPGAFADAGDSDRSPADLHLARSRLGQCVGGHDAGGRLAPASRLQRRQCGGQPGLDALDRQRFHDHAGRKRQHLRRLHAHQRRQGGTGAVGTLQAVGTGAGIGVAGVDHQRADAGAHGRLGEVLAAHLHRCGAEAVQRENAGHHAAFVERQQHEVTAMGLAHTSHRHPDANSGHRQQGLGVRSGQIDGHGGCAGAPGCRGLKL